MADVPREMYVFAFFLLAAAGMAAIIIGLIAYSIAEAIQHIKNKRRKNKDVN